MNKTASMHTHRAGIYALLAEVLAPPPHDDALARLSDGAWVEELQEHLRALGDPVAIPDALLSPRKSPEQLGREYLDAFYLPKGLRIWLVESIYKPWTKDESAEVPFRAETGLLGGDSAVHMREIITRLGVELPPELQGTPDHLAILLEMMSLLVEEADEGIQAMFLAQHLDWLRLMVARRDEAGLEGAYRALTDLVDHFIDWDRRRIDPAAVAPCSPGFSERK